MGRLQAWVIGEVVAPVALLSSIALSPEDTVRYGRHRRKTVISLRSPSLVLLVIGSTLFFPLSGLVLWLSYSQTLFYVASPRQALLRVPVPF